MADSYPPFTTRSLTRDNLINRNSSRNNYTRFVGKLLFLAFFLIAIPLFPSQAPDFINQTILNKFWELLHLMFIGIAVSYGLFGRRNVDNYGCLDDSQSYVPGMLHVSSIFEDGCDHSMYYSGQGKAGFFNVKNGSFENPYEENAVQAWRSKYFQGEPMVVLAQPSVGLEKYAQSAPLFVDYKPLGLPVRSLKSRVVSQGSPEFGNGSSMSSGSSVKDLSDCSDKSGNLRFGDLGSENLEGKFNESTEVLGSPIPWRSRSGRVRERVHGGTGATRSSHFRPLSVDETQFESLKSRSLRSTVSFSSQVSSQSHSPSSLSPSHSNSSDSPKSKLSELAKERSPHRSFPPAAAPIPKPMTSTKASMSAAHSRQYSDGSLLGTHARKCFEEELKEFCDSKNDDSSSRLSPSHSNSSDSPKSKLSELTKERSPRQSFPPGSAPIPKPVSSTKASMSAAHSRQYSDGSLLGIHARKGFEEELNEFCDSNNDDSSSSKEWLSGSFKFDAKPAAPSKAPSRGKSVRTFRSFRTFRTNGNTIGAREAGEKHDNHLKGKLAMTSNEVEEAYADKSEPKVEGLINSLSVGLNGQNLGGDSYMPKPISPENQIREKQECSEDSEVESTEDSERENEDFHESSDDETMSATLSVAGSEVDRKAGEFIAKFREQIRLQRTSSIDSTPRGFNIRSNIFR